MASGAYDYMMKARSKAETERLLHAIRAYTEVDPAQEDMPLDRLLNRTKSYTETATQDHDNADLGGEG